MLIHSIKYIVCWQNVVSKATMLGSLCYSVQYDFVLISIVKQDKLTPNKVVWRQRRFQILCWVFNLYLPGKACHNVLRQSFCKVQCYPQDRLTIVNWGHNWVLLAYLEKSVGVALPPSQLATDRFIVVCDSGMVISNKLSEAS